MVTERTFGHWRSFYKTLQLDLRSNNLFSRHIPKLSPSWGSQCQTLWYHRPRRSFFSRDDSRRLLGRQDWYKNLNKILTEFLKLLWFSLGCYKLKRFGALDCQFVTKYSLASLLKYLPDLVTLHSDRIVECIEVTINDPVFHKFGFECIQFLLQVLCKTDRDFYLGRRHLKIRNLDQVWNRIANKCSFCSIMKLFVFQFGEFFDFEQHPNIIPMMLRSCPLADSLRLYVDASAKAFE